MDWAPKLPGTVTRRGLLIGAASIGGAVALRDRSSPAAPRAVPPRRSYPNAEILVSPLELAASPIQLLDASPLADYRRTHIPGARHVWWQDTMELNSPYYGTVLKPDDGESDQTRRQQLLERWQIQADSPVVVYDRADSALAARVAWFLRFLTIPAEVLDGGFAGWLALEKSSRGAVTTVDQTGPTARSMPREGFYLDVRETGELLGATGSHIVDVRTEEERARGAMADQTANGVSWLPRNQLLAANGLVRPADELQTLATQAGIDLAAGLVLIGDSGLDTALPWLALTLMGTASVTICDGGWQQWRDELPTVPL